MCESPPAESDPTLKRKVEPYRQNRARQEELGREAEALRTEQSGLRNELKELGADPLPRFTPPEERLG